jgi:ABC-type transport system involved in multi-copper enzyme maturation permease subunit
MTGMIGAEFRRILARRSFRLLGAFAIFAIVFGGVIVFVQSSHDPNSGLKQAQALVQSCHQQQSQGPQVLKRGGGDQVRVIGGCPTVQDVLPGFDKRFKYAEAIPSTTQNIAFPLFFLAFAVAASFVGAEWGTGMMTTTLTWEPRRGRVLLAKIIPAVVVLGTAAVVLLTFLAIAYIPIGALRGTTAGMTGAFWQHLSGLWLRAGLLAAFGAALGVGLATLTRNTVAALGIGFGYLAVADPIFSHLWKERFAPWLFMQNFMRAMRQPIEKVVSQTSFGDRTITAHVMSSTRPAILFTIYALALLGVAYAAFRTRDVT